MAQAPDRPVSGRYRGTQRGYEIELRVDVDGPRPTMRISADYSRVTNGTPKYVGSMRVDAPHVRVARGRVTITGTGSFTWSTRRRRIEVTIARLPAHAPRAPATLRHDGSGDARGASYVCAFESECFRTVELAEAAQPGVKPLRSYDTGSLPSGGPARTLSTALAFREAGVELVSSGEPAVIDTAAAGADATWSDAELHAAMETTFADWRDSARWAVWLLHATDHDNPAIAGMMFDRSGAQRQGCAIFYGTTPRSSADVLRNDLHTCMHELGHTFNLLHSWQKSDAIPPVPSRPAAASWMNYPDRFPGGADAYWSAFSFEFDEAELVHVRHGFRDAVIPGGAPLRGGAARVREAGAEPDRRDPGLRLRLKAPPAIPYGVPVTVGAELSATTARGREVPAVIGPQSQSLDILIRAPGGEESVFVPLLRHCRSDETRTLRATDAPLRSQPFLHFGQDGFAFPTPGRYTLRARFACADGRTALSDPVALRVLAPTSRADREIDRLISGDEQVGALITLMGSDAPHLRAGDDKLREIIERHPHHPVAAAARLVRGTNLARSFKRLDAGGAVTVRQARPEDAANLIGAVVDLAALRRVRGPQQRTAAGARAAAAAVARAGTRPGIAPSVGAFVVSRRQEVAAAHESLTPARVPA